MTADDGRIITDIVIGSLLAGGIRLILLKSFLEPLAFWAGRQGWHFLDSIVGGRLPDLPK